MIDNTTDIAVLVEMNISRSMGLDCLITLKDD